MAKKSTVNIRSKLKERTHRKLKVYKELHGLKDLDAVLNIMLEKATEHIKLPD